MLPGATGIETRRDRIETAWSCYKQHFYRLPHFSCDFDHIAAFMGDCERAMDAWRARDPGRVHLQSYAALLCAAEGTIRALLDACGLPFDPACLQFQDAKRSVRTATAPQVRHPLQPDTGRTGPSGPLPDPLREGPAAGELPRP